MVDIGYEPLTQYTPFDTPHEPYENKTDPVIQVSEPRGYWDPQTHGYNAMDNDEKKLAKILIVGAIIMIVVPSIIGFVTYKKLKKEGGIFKMIKKGVK